MPQIKSNFTFKSSEPNFARDRYMNHEEMRSVTIEDIDVGHIVYCNSDQKHYIFKGNNVGFNSELGYFRALELHDTITVDNIGDLTNYPTAGLPEGKLVYCQANKQIYYYAGENFNDDEIGHFKLLVDMQDGSYVTFDSEEWSGVVDTIEDLSNASMLVFDTIDEMSSYTPTEFVNEGQLAYCKELDRHFYLIKNNNEFVEDGYYGYFRLVCDADAVNPKITQPNMFIGVEYNEETFAENKWEITEIDGVKVLLITEESDAPNIAAVTPIIYRGEIDYSDFPYYDGELQIPYIGTGDLTSDMYMRQQDEPVLGNNEFYAAVKASTNIPTPTDINGILREDLKWDSTQSIESNPIIVNKTEPWYATTSDQLDKQPLIPWLDEMVGYATLLPTCQCNQQFQIPSGRELKKLYIMGLAGYVEEDLSEWRQNGNTYTYIGSHRGSVEIKVVF